jgi:hypothetical protein
MARRNRNRNRNQAGLAGAGGGGNRPVQKPSGGIGGQLERRVQSGVIDMAQAKKVAAQRQTFRKAYGPDWRTKVFGDRGYVQRTRTALAETPGDPQLQALNQNLKERRKRLLAAARKQG